MLATFSLHSVVNSAGAYAGLGALIGLALLVLLYFAQAREIRRLSDWIEQEEERRAASPLQPQLRPQQPRATVAAQGAPPPQPAAGAVTTAVPGVRRVAVPGAQTAPVAGGAAPSSATVAGGAAPAPATAVAGSTAAAIPATTAAAQRVVAAPVEEPVIAAATGAAPSAAPPAPSREESAVDGDDPPAPRPAGAAVPLSGPRIATAQPPEVLLASSEEPAAGSESERAPAAGSESERAPAAGSESERAPAAGSQSERAPAAEPGLAAAGATGSPARRAPESALQAEPEARPDPSRPAQEPAPLAPATAAALRTRFPPPPPQERVAPIPVSAGAMMSAPGLTAAAAEQGRFDPFGVEPTRRRPAGDGASASPPQGPRPRADERPPRPMWGSLRLLVAAVAIVAVLIFVVTQVVGGGSSPSAGKTSPTSTSTHTGSGKTHSTTPPPAPDTITVSVLNGTTVTDLASGAWKRLEARGFKQGAIANAPSQTHVRTIVGYVSGARAAAVEVAGDLGLHAADAQPVDSASLTAGSTGGVSPTIVVTLGSEYAQSQ